jgi:Flp pilus assembly protein TadG
MRREHRREAGVSLLETAITIPLLLILLVGVVDIGRAYHTYITVINASREGARFGVNRPWDINGIRTVVRNEASTSGVDLSGATIIVDQSGSGNPVRVTVQVNYPLFIGGVIGLDTIPISATTVFRAR